jgi:NifB/MoaA-like Fe-S oxidoreductase
MSWFGDCPANSSFELSQVRSRDIEVSDFEKKRHLLVSRTRELLPGNPLLHHMKLYKIGLLEFHGS